MQTGARRKGKQQGRAQMAAHMLDDSLAQESRVLSLQMGSEAPASGCPGDPPRIVGMLAVTAASKLLHRGHIGQKTRDLGARPAVHALGKVNTKKPSILLLQGGWPLQNKRIQDCPKMGRGRIFKGEPPPFLRAGTHDLRGKAIKSICRAQTWPIRLRLQLGRNAKGMTG